ncbi:MAG: hypothetical protein ACRC2B_14795 [Rubrivivax sp.]
MQPVDRFAPSRPGHQAPLGPESSQEPPLSNAELVQLRVRVIALENLVIALLAEASERQLALVREMSTHISPRPGFTAHRLTIHAASEMLSLMDRATRFLSRAAKAP